MNPIIQAMVEHMNAGKNIAQVHLDNRVHPRRVFFHFSDGAEAETPIEADHATFMTWWKVASDFSHIKWEPPTT